MVRNKTLHRWTKAVQACERKTCYDQEEAHRVADQRSVQEQTIYMAYQCIVCDCWHIGHDTTSPLARWLRKQQQQKTS